MAQYPNIKNSVGIELVKERHEVALKLRDQLSMYPVLSKVKLIHNDAFKEVFSDYVSGKTLVWISNLCMGNEITQKFFDKFANELSKGSIICCSTRIESRNKNIDYKMNLIIPMSWKELSDVYVYEII